MKKKIMLIPPTALPIPAVGGGAIETLITNLLDQNEIEQQVEFIVISKYDKEAEKIHYKHSKIYYFKGDELAQKFSLIRKMQWQLYNLWVHIFLNRIIAPILKLDHEGMGYYEYQCYQIAKRNRVNTVVCEGVGEWKWKNMNHLVGKDHVFTHIHSDRKEDLRARAIIQNSISVSKYVRDQWVITKELPGKNEVLYNGIDIKRFALQFTDEQRICMRRNLGISEQDILVLFCGRIVKGKGIKELLDSFEQLKGEPIKLLLIGSVGFSNKTTTEFSNEIMNRAEKMDNVIPLGYIPNEKIPQWYAIADIQVIPSIWQEGYPLVSIEGMAAGLPIIATRSGGLIECLDKNTSIQLPIDDNLSENIANSIRKLKDDPDLCAKMAAAGRERARQFDLLHYYYNYLDIVGQ